MASLEAGSVAGGIIVGIVLPFFIKRALEALFPLTAGGAFVIGLVFLLVTGGGFRIPTEFLWGITLGLSLRKYVV